MLRPFSPKPTEITQSRNYHIGSSVGGGTESGFVLTKFLNTRPLIGVDVNSNKTVQLMGLPVIGVTLGRFSNNNAAPGVMAQYGFAHKVKSKVRMTEQ